MINEKYSYNGYNPSSQEAKDKKAELLEMLKNRVISIKQYSHSIADLKRCFKGKTFLGEPPEGFEGEIKHTSFAQKEPNTEVFPADITTTFDDKCDLTNIKMPAGSVFNSERNKQVKVQNDGETWIVNKKLEPVEPLHPKRYEEFGLSKDPKNIPSKMLPIPITEKAAYQALGEERKARIIEIANNPALLNKLINEKGEI